MVAQVLWPNRSFNFWGVSFSMSPNKSAIRLLILGWLLLFSEGVFAYTMSGTVYGGSNSLSNVTVKAKISTGDSDESQTQTDSNGRFSLDLPSGSYDINIIPPINGGWGNSKITGVYISDSDIIKNIVLIPTEFQISGFIKGAGGSVLPNVRVSLIASPGGTDLGAVITDSQGRYGFGVGPGTYGFNLEHYGAAWGGVTDPLAEPNHMWRAFGVGDVVVSGNTSYDIQLPFIRINGKTKSGSGTPVGGVSLKSILNPGEWIDPFGVARQVNMDGESNSQSNEGGDYSLVVRKGNASITMTPPTNSGLDVVIKSISFLSNTVYDLLLQSSDRVYGVIYGAGKKPLPNVSVNLVSNGVIGSMTTDSQGRYGFGVGPGTYSFNLEHYGAAWGGVTDPLAEPNHMWRAFGIGDVVVSGNTSYDIQLPFIRLSGKAIDSNSVPIKYVKINNSLTSYGFYIDGNSSALSDLNGNYFLVSNIGANDVGIIPPLDSGFSSLNISNMNLMRESTLDIVIPFDDSLPPKILAGPLATQINQKQATILWQTDEPAKGSVTVGNRMIEETEFVTHHSVLIDDLSASTTYTAEVTATDQSNNGPTRGSVTFATSTAPDNRPPLIVAGPTISAVTSNGAVVEWETNEPATTVVTGEASYTGVGFATLHKAELTGLTPDTRYAIEIASSDELGNGPTQRRLRFTTLAAADAMAPVIRKGPWFVDITADGATVVWETDELSNSGVSYNDGVAYGVLNDDALSLTHSVRMTGLMPDTVYHVTVSSKDAFGNGPTLSEPFDVTTLAAADTEAPVFLEPPTACNINQQLIQLCFRTDEPASVVVEYGTDPNALGTVEARAQMIRQHSLPINGLNSLTTYFFRVSVTDEAGNTTVSAPIQATTLVGGNGPPGFLVTPAAAYQGKDRVVISWETNRPCSALVEYGVGKFDLQASDGQLKTKHSIVLPNLKAGQSYQFRVTATDVDGNKVEFGF